MGEPDNEFGEWLLLISDNFPKQTQFNTVFPTQEEMDRVGVEPTTSAPSIVVSKVVN